MLQRLGKMHGWTMMARDGDIGKVDDFYFDDQRWTVRYLLVETGGWLSGKRVLISPIAFEGIDRDHKRFRVSLTREQVKNSPDADLHQPISRRYETDYSDYYRYPYYWGGAGLWGAEPVPVGLGRMREMPPAPRGPITEEEKHLRSVSEVSGYHIRALDGEIGHVDDFLADSESWAIRYLLVDTSNFIGGKWVLVAPDWARRIDWNQLAIHVDMTRDDVKNSPEYDPDKPLQREYEERLHSHYHRTVYWR
jgi:hypothetical protein